MSTKRSKNIEYGNIELPADEFDSKNVKIRVTTLLDEDVLIKLKNFAKSRGSK